jgi:amidase
MPHNSAIEQLSALRSRKISSAELVDAAIERIQKVDGEINAVVVKDFDRAREAALAADEDRKAGADRPLLGLPLTVKEAFDVEGLPTTWGLPGKHAPAAADAVLVGRLRSAGAIILGKTNVAGMLADWQTANELFGVTNNPWNLERTSGGSSGGGAAAVACGMTPLEFGSDLAGSLRIPAAFCGVYAHRPSHGIVPMRGFAPPMAPRTPISQPIDQSTLGPIARTAADLKMALDLVPGPDVPDSAAWRLSLPSARHTELKDFRVLVLDERLLVPTSQDIHGAIDKVAKQLWNEGCRVGQSLSEVPDMKDLTWTFSALLMSMMGVDMPGDDYAAAFAHANGKEGTPHEQSMTMSHRDWVLLDRHRLALAARWVETFERWDVVLCPAAPCTAFPHDRRPFGKRKLDVNGSKINYEKTPFWTTLATPTGLPVTTVPIGADNSGLPIGIQIIGPRLEDYTPLSFAELLERRLGYRFKAPTI